jgi:hypothetical protein
LDKDYVFQSVILSIESGDAKGFVRNIGRYDPGCRQFLGQRQGDVPASRADVDDGYFSAGGQVQRFIDEELGLRPRDDDSWLNPER